ncbi:DUF4393 domain-containing protein [Pseudomonas leptonychotis]|uniref:DUF4393 domain-containing protein n=1 Tax=Pseudomonas leptonychotis TaxID=2448482 RepID=A0A4V4R7E3_9PSED|nr:DUF4393 domain-containing protein [Pseudomonas leptonychotis]TIH06234.1 DUF4393 domain-containing protein [Pseudomonas leptonychotis]
MGTEDKSYGVVTDTIGKVASDVYADVARPAARQIGSALETLFKVSLSPVSMLDWGFEQSKDWLKKKVEERTSKTPQNFLRTPPNNIAIPALTSISMSADAPELRELYAELLLKAMDSRTEPMVHPSYINVIGQLTSQEALVFISFQEIGSTTLFQENNARYSHGNDLTIEIQFINHCLSIGLENTKYMQLWLENLQRLKLIDLREYSEVSYVEPDADTPYPSVNNREDRYLELTIYGREFLKACTPPDAV